MNKIGILYTIRLITMSGSLYDSYIFNTADGYTREFVEKHMRELVSAYEGIRCELLENGKMLRGVRK